ncbi:MAG: succinate dehydrogenase, hydrophobic membrane anchor protein [Alphaproteobacteria bacterium]
MMARDEQRSALGRARGLGAAGEGVGHWWAQRLTAVALAPLSLWLVASLVGKIGASRAEVVDWAASPLVAVLLVATLVALFHHAQLGLQVIVEDYLHTPWIKIAAIVLIKGAAIFLALLGILTVLLMALGRVG